MGRLCLLDVILPVTDGEAGGVSHLSKLLDYEQVPVQESSNHKMGKQALAFT